MTENYTWKESTGKLMIRDTKHNYNMTFHNQDGKQVGELNYNGPEMVFTGDADESAKLFFDFIANAFKGRLDQERADEREACAKVCDDKHDTWRWDDEPDSASGPRDCAAAIRARGMKP